MKEIINDLKNGSNFAFGEIYKNNFVKILSFVKKNNGNEIDAEDLFQDSMLVLLEKLRTDNFYLTASINTYVYAICKNLWLKKIRNQAYQLSFDEIQNQDFQKSISDSIKDEMNYSEKLKRYLTKVTDHCNRLIQDLFFKQKTIQQIQKDYGYTSKHNAQNQKHKCVNQIRKIKKQEENKKK